MSLPITTEYTNLTHKFNNSLNNNEFNLGSQAMTIIADNEVLGNTILASNGISNSVSGLTCSFENLTKLPLLQTALFAVNQPPDTTSLSVNSKLYLTNTNPPDAPTQTITIDASNLLIEYESDTNQDLILQSSSSGSLKYIQTGVGATTLELILNPESLTIQDSLSFGSVDGSKLTNSQLLIQNLNSFGDYPTSTQITKDGILIQNDVGDMNTLSALYWSGNSATATNADTAFNAIQVSITPFPTTFKDYYMTFVDSSGNQSPHYDNVNSFTYNPSTQRLTAQQFQGSLVGNADSATSATTIRTTSDNTSGNYYIPFSKTTAGATTTLYLDDTTTPLTYNPSTNYLTATKFIGDLSGNAVSATNVAITDQPTTNTTYYLTFVTATSGNQPTYVDSSTLTYNSSTNLLLVNGLQLGTATNAITSFTANYLTIEGNSASNREFNFPITADMNGLTISNRRGNGVYKINITNSSGASRTINSALSTNSSQPNKTSYATATIAVGEFWVMTIKVLNFAGTLYNCVSLEKFV